MIFFSVLQERHQNPTEYLNIYNYVYTRMLASHGEGLWFESRLDVPQLPNCRNGYQHSAGAGEEKVLTT